MHQSIDKKQKYIFLIIIFLFLTTINNTNFVNKKYFSANIKNIQVVGLTEDLNLQIQKRLSYLKNNNIFYINKELLKKKIDEYKYIESFKVSKFYPKKIVLNLYQTNFLAITIKNNQKYILGSNGKLIEYELFNNYDNLPIIFGNFSTNDFLNFKKEFDQSSLKYKDIKVFFFYPSKRWDIQTIDNVIVKLPSKNTSLALERASKIIESKQFDNNIIDLRITRQIILTNE